MMLAERLGRWADGAEERYPNIMASEIALVREAKAALEAAERRAKYAREELDARTAFVEAQAEAPSIDMGDGYPWAVHALTERQAYSKSEIAVLLAEQYNRATQAEANCARLTSNPADLRYWEGRYRDEAAALATVEAQVAVLREALVGTQRTLGFLKSVVRSGEPWTDTADRMYDEACAKIDAALSNLRKTEEDDG